MTKKDYVLIAHTINYCKHKCDIGDKSYTMNGKRLISDEAITGEVLMIKHITNWLSYNLKNENYKFDEVKFIKACGFTPVIDAQDGSVSILEQ